MQDYFTEFADHLEANDSSRHTIRGYMNDLKSFVNWYYVLMAMIKSA